MGTGPAISEAKLGAFRGAEKAARDWPFIAFRVSAAQRARWMQPGPRISRPVATQKEQKEESELGTVSFLHAGDTNDVLLLFLLLARNKAFPEFQVPPRPSILRPFAFPRAQENTAGVLRRKAPDKKPIKGPCFLGGALSAQRRAPRRSALPASAGSETFRAPPAGHGARAERAFIPGPAASTRPPRFFRRRNASNGQTAVSFYFLKISSSLHRVPMKAGKLSVVLTRRFVGAVK